MIATIVLAAALGSGQPSDPFGDIQAMRIAWSGVRYVQVVEQFSTGNVATVEYAPTGTPQISFASTAQKNPLVNAVLHPGGDSSSDLHQLFAIKSLGTDRSGGDTLRGYELDALNGTGTETLWINAMDLPVKAHIASGNQSIDVLYGNYEVPLYFATKNS